MSTQCYHCSAALAVGQDVCEACQAPQTEFARGYFLRALQAEKKMVSQRSMWAILCILLFVAGAVGGMSINRSAAEDLAAQEEFESQVSSIPIESINDLFMRGIEEQLHLGLRSWYVTPDGATIFEMNPPNPAMPKPVWEALNQAEREKVMAYFSVAYTQVLLKSGRSIDFRVQGHPAVGLAYYGTRGPVALRARSGDVMVYRSPFAQ